MHFNERTCWGKLIYAQDDYGCNVVEALSAALVVQAHDIARGLRSDALHKTKFVKELDFHATSVYGNRGSVLPEPGQLVDINLNVDGTLLSVFYR